MTFDYDVKIEKYLILLYNGFSYLNMNYIFCENSRRIS